MPRLTSLGSLRNFGIVNFMTIDPGVTCTGVCVRRTDFSGHAASESAHTCILSPMKDSDYIDAIMHISEAVGRVVSTTKPSVLILELPSPTVYGANIMVKSAIIKRANDIRKTAMLCSAIMVEVRGHRNLYFGTVEPSQWQDKRGIKQHGDSKKWSMALASKISTRSISNHNLADAICMNAIVSAKIKNGELA